MLTSVGFEGSRATGSVFQLFQEPNIRTHSTDGTRGGCSVVECKIELTFVKLGAAYYGMCSARQSHTNNCTKRRMNGIFGERERANWPVRGRASQPVQVAWFQLLISAIKIPVAPPSSGLSRIRLD